jgi:hypothetical protein
MKIAGAILGLAVALVLIPELVILSCKIGAK